MRRAAPRVPGVGVGASEETTTDDNDDDEICGHRYANRGLLSARQKPATWADGPSSAGALMGDAANASAAPMMN